MGRFAKIFDPNLRIYSLLEDEPGLRYRKNIAIEELSLSRCAYYESRIARRGHAARASVSGKRGRRARRAAAAVWFQVPSLDWDLQGGGDFDCLVSGEEKGAVGLVGLEPTI